MPGNTCRNKQTGARWTIRRPLTGSLTEFGLALASPRRERFASCDLRMCCEDPTNYLVARRRIWRTLPYGQYRCNKMLATRDTKA